MEIIKVDGGMLTHEQEQNVKLVLKEGGVVMHATETCYGFTCDFFEPRAWQRLFDVKRIPKNKPVSIMVRDIYEAKKYGVFSYGALRLAKEFWPGPLTIIVPRTSYVPGYVSPDDETVGIRCSDFSLPRTLIGLNGRPLCTTSANVSGEPESYRIEDYFGQIEVLKGRGMKVSMPDVILDSGGIPSNPPSTIVKMVGEEIIFLREGMLRKKIESFLG